MFNSLLDFFPPTSKKLKKHFQFMGHTKQGFAEPCTAEQCLETIHPSPTPPVERGAFLGSACE